MLHIRSLPSSQRLESLVKRIQKTLEKHEFVQLCALEKAMIVALDAARMICSWNTEHDTGIQNVSSVASMVQLHTSYQDMPARGLETPPLRSKISITLKRSVAFQRHIVLASLQEV